MIDGCDAIEVCVTLTALDNCGASASDSFILTVNNVNCAPSVDAGRALCIDEGSSVVLQPAAFDPDGYLLLGLGDGGGGGDPQENGQNQNTLLGSLLRIDVSGDDFPSDSGRNYAIPADNPFVGTSGADEIWAYGLRNPWRFSVDDETGLLYIADVGQSQREEVNVVSMSSAGLNYGWNSV